MDKFSETNQNIILNNELKLNILSWDVGIKHLAYNLSTYTKNFDKPDKIDLTINQWGIINLSVECCSYCNQDGIYKNEIEDKDNKENKKTVYYCDEHCKKLKVKHFCNINGCYEKAKYCLDIPDENIEENTTNKQKYVCDNHGPKIYSNDMSTEFVKIKLIEKLDKINFQQFDHVLIENQPTFKNPKMKAIADTLYAWFLIRKIIDLKVIGLKNLKLISPSRKSKLYLDTVIESKKSTGVLNLDSENENIESENSIEKGKKKLSKEMLEILEEEESKIEKKEPKKLSQKITKEKLAYKDGKKKSIEFCMSIITQEWKDFIGKFTKKDDLADCLLQGYIYFMGIKQEKQKIVKKEKKDKNEKKEKRNNKKLKEEVKEEIKDKISEINLEIKRKNKKK